MPGSAVSTDGLISHLPLAETCNSTKCEGDRVQRHKRRSSVHDQDYGKRTEEDHHCEILLLPRTQVSLAPEGNPCLPFLQTKAHDVILVSHIISSHIFRASFA